MPYFLLATLVGGSRARRRESRNRRTTPALSGRELLVALAEEVGLAARALLLPVAAMSAAAGVVVVAFASVTPGPVLDASRRSMIAMATAAVVGALWFSRGRRRAKGGAVNA